MLARVVASSLVIPCLLVALLAGCLPAPAAAPSPSAAQVPTALAGPAGDGVLRIGTLFPSSGAAAFLGAPLAAGVALAVRDLNEAGGVAGVPVELVARDSGDAGSGTVESGYAELVAAGVDVVIGPASTVLVQRLLPAIQETGVPVISPAATLPLQPPAGGADGRDLVFRTVGSYGLQGSALARELAGQRVALITIEGDAAAARLGQLLGTGLTATGGELAVARVASGTTDFAALTAQLDAAAPDSVVVATPGSAADTTRVLLPAVVAAGFGGSRLWLTGQNTADYSQALAAGVLNGANAILEGFVGGDDWTDRLKSVDGGLVAFRYAAESYDAVQLAALAAITAGDDGPGAIAAGLREASRGGIKCVSVAECAQVLRTGPDLDYDGVSGPLTLDSSGEVVPAYYGIYTYNGENQYSFARGVVAD